MHSPLLVRGQLAHLPASRVVDAEGDVTALRQRVADEVGDDRAESRIRRRVLAVAESARASHTTGDGAVGVVFRGRFHREEISAGAACLRQFFQWRNVIHDEDPATMRPDYQVVLAGVHHDVVYSHRWNVVLQLSPRCSTVCRVESSELRPGKEETRLCDIFANDLYRAVCGKISRYRSPVSAIVGTPQHVRLEIVVAMIVHGRVYGSFIEP